ncbi:MAG: KH domain-containing protein, partial [Lentisphaeria bacterium]|nr:KH domain-containing protein [Lentisphaeria bacterium]
MSEITMESRKEKLIHTLATMFDYLGLNGNFRVEEKGQKLTVKITSDDAGRIIGRKGQTLDSLQLILNRIMFKGDEEFPRIMLDIDGYSSGEHEPRERRESG